MAATALRLIERFGCSLVQQGDKKTMLTAKAQSCPPTMTTTILADGLMWTTIALFNAAIQDTPVDEGRLETGKPRSAGLQLMRTVELIRPARRQWLKWVPIPHLELVRKPC